ncbi:uroporphyrinogen-III synthase [Caenimonas aquaedulcis]|uniref:Uroporphyrinogen-III synthase n=1 Tax=Caenimonas aquaedulcis TaxID=2793270 RepID=A0A931MH60_9BURK|nr:uroporphyrinogen-III synthase [Caenimonas aquaedulcis]MBG9387905.1 uroporphyrinogen-III synthase [Caenimonas aquaedulcis]
MRVIVTRPAAEAGAWVSGLSLQGFDAVSFPLIAIEPVGDAQALQRAWRALASMPTRAVMFVSGNAVRHFFAQRPAGASWPVRTRAWATGSGTRDALLAAGVDAAWVDAPAADAAQFDSETLWQRVASQIRAGDAVLIVRGSDGDGEPAGRDWLAEQLAAAGASVQSVAAYVRRAPVYDGAATRAIRMQWADAVWLFSSSQAVANLSSFVPGADWSKARAIATHARIAERARRAGFGVVCESRPGLDAVVAALKSLG